MKTSHLGRFVLAVVLSAAILGGCKARPAPPAAPAADAQASPTAQAGGASYAVAPFTSPVTGAELLAGYIPQGAAPVSGNMLVKLDMVMDQVAGSARTRIKGADKAIACMETVARPEGEGRPASLRYWQAVGRCVGVDYLVVPQIITLSEREGSPMGATRPASVNMSLFLLDVKSGGVLKSFHFDETQKTLADNILDMKKFMDRKGRWVSASELAEEGLRRGMAEFGL